MKGVPVVVAPGQRYGEWVVISEVAQVQGKRRVKVRCSCGKEVDRYLALLRLGSSSMCRSCAMRARGNLIEVPPGTHFGKWEVLDEGGRRKGSRLLLCKCSCGVEQAVSYSSLMSGDSHSCKRCAHKTENTVEVGQTRGRWEVLAETERRGSNRYFLCRCTCGTEQAVDYSTLLRASGCAYCFQEKQTFPENRGPLGPQWGKIRRGAKARGIPLNVDQVYVYQIFQEQGGKCALSGVAISLGTSQTRRGTASLDRIDSNMEYVPGNLQWVHKDVNIMKNAFSQAHFIQMCNRVADHKRQA